jgi:hypothetical protein
MLTASVQSSGKSTLADIVFQAAYGRPGAAASWTDNQDEMQKHILAMLLEGQSGVCFDNLPFGCLVDGEELAKLITQELYQARILGKNVTATVPTNILVAVTGNQLAAVNDMATRLLPIYLAPDVECPENRVFERKNIDAWHEENRSNIVTAVCTIFLAFHQCGEDVEIKPSRFVEWDEEIRKPLVWLEVVDPIVQFESNRDEDPLKESRSRLLKAWREEFGEREVQLSEVVEFWPECPSYIEENESGLAAALIDLFPENKPTTQHAGKNFRYFRDRVYDGLKLVHKESDTKSKAARPWRVCSVAA